MKQVHGRPIKRKRKYTKRALRYRREFLLSLLAIIITVTLMIVFHSSPTKYKVVIFEEDQSMDVIQIYPDFKIAKKEMQKQVEAGAFNPAILDMDDNIVAIHYGIVNFTTKTCGENTTYTLDVTEETGYTNGCYGGDGAYLDTDNSAKKVKFKQSGAVGWVNISDIEILNAYDSTLQSSNRYEIVDQQIIHKGTVDVKSAAYALQYPVGDATTSLSKSNYYSYDGHYFYEDFPTMIDDYRKNSYDQSVNKDTPNYNYYQYISHRSTSSYLSKDINWYISNYLGFLEKPTQYPPYPAQSQLFDEGYSFIDSQSRYGVNAIMMLSLAANESGLGKSQIAYEKNNLFGHAAYDNAPSESANGYATVADSIKTHAEIFLNNGYLNPCDQAEAGSNPDARTCSKLSNRYAGGFFGDKASGMNVHYASDPYWGEKAAHYYRSFDQVMGNRDYEKETIKILKDATPIKAYASADTDSNVIMITPPYEHMAFLLVKEVEGQAIEDNTTWYLVQSDGIVTPKRTGIQIETDQYNFKEDLLYIHSSYFK